MPELKLNKLTDAAADINTEEARILIELTESTEFSSDKNMLLARKWLRNTACRSFMKALNGEEYRNRWAEQAFRLIQAYNYSFLHLFEDRANSYPDKILFSDMTYGSNSEWTYTQIFSKIKETAAALYTLGGVNVKVALISENSLEMAVTDLACLTFDIFVSPLNIHFSEQELATIIDSCSFNLVITDTVERAERLKKVMSLCNTKFEIILLNEDSPFYKRLPQFCKSFQSEEIDEILSKRRVKPINEVATTMFTSGSTGIPKGVSFSIYNIVSKRFARAAALPDVGINEKLLCFLPLYHTFGRYLEMTGMIYWGGTYTFAGNSSAESLMSLFPKVNPSGFISVPVRWVQLYERIIEEIDNTNDEEKIREITNKIAGSKLRWGLSAAGWLDPKVFMFFQKYGIELSSGFGMTEATGGITMTPPGNYIENSTGKALPGIITKFRENGEMLIGGHYVARYFDDKKPGDTIPFPADEEFFVPTGDIFQVNENGFYQIIDRVKDIYKNSKGQTVAPRNVEMRFEGVAGIKRTFLVGDGKAFNVLLIVPDYTDPIFESNEIKENVEDYFKNIITLANRELAQYERVVNFAVLRRDFTVEKGELTSKGSYNRKNIEKHFSYLIDKLYKYSSIDIKFKTFTARFPIWFVRDLGILESDLIKSNSNIKNKQTNIELRIEKLTNGRMLIGDLEYQVNSAIIDMGLFARQPKLWAGNPALIRFAPIKDGWDAPLKNVENAAFYDYSQKPDFKNLELKGIRNPKLKEINEVICLFLFSDEKEALEAMERAQTIIKETDHTIADTIKRRLQALAYHESEEVRSTAYRVLLLDEPTADYGTVLPAFIQSGLSFINQRSIEIISKSSLEKRRLDALRKRLMYYRLHLAWPSKPEVRSQFESVFKLLVSFVKHNPEYYSSVREELAAWALHKQDAELAYSAEKFFYELSCRYEDSLNEKSKDYSIDIWNERLVFEDGLSKSDVSRIKQVLVSSAFLKQSVILAFDEQDFDLMNVPKGGIWISRINSAHNHSMFRVSINTITRRHYDLVVVIRENYRKKINLDTVFWLIVVAGIPTGPSVIPKLGCCRPELEARSMIYYDELSVWEKIRETASLNPNERDKKGQVMLRKYFVEGIAAFFRAWLGSGRAIVPGVISPSNVIVPDMDIDSNSAILSLAGWTYYKNTLSLLKPILKNFFGKTSAHYTWCSRHLNLFWIFDAAEEALGSQEAKMLFSKFLIDLNKSREKIMLGEELADAYNSYLRIKECNYRMPSVIHNAIEKYNDWKENNIEAEPAAKDQTVQDICRLYSIYKLHDLARFSLWRYTYFADASMDIRVAFDNLINAMNKNPDKSAVHFIELTELQDSFEFQYDRDVFSRMVFPAFKTNTKFDLLKIVEKNRKDVIVQTFVFDKYGEQYFVREPIEASEIGSLYRIFIKEKYPVSITENDDFLLLIDAHGKIIGGISYKATEDNSALLEGIAVSSQFKSFGLGSALANDFAARMKSRGIQMLKTHFVLRHFFEKLGFSTDKRWGMMVKMLDN